jgi:hypothetical protein
MQKKQASYLIRLVLFGVGLVALIATAVFLPSPLVQAQTADPQLNWGGGGLGEVTGEARLLPATVNPDADTDGDGIINGEEGDGILPGTYGRDAYMNPNLCTLITDNAYKISMKINTGRFLDVHVMHDDDPNRPEKTIDTPDFPYGFISFKIVDLDKNRNSVVQLKIFFPQKVSTHAKLFRYQGLRPDQYVAQIGYDIGNGNIWKYDDDYMASFQSITLTLIDNDSTYDADIQEITGNKGVIEGIWGLGVPKAGSKGRCFIQTLPGRWREFTN